MNEQWKKKPLHTVRPILNACTMYVLKIYEPFCVRLCLHVVPGHVTVLFFSRRNFNYWC